VRNIGTGSGAKPVATAPASGGPTRLLLWSVAIAATPGAGTPPRASMRQLVDSSADGATLQELVGILIWTDREKAGIKMCASSAAAKLGWMAILTAADRRRAAGTICAYCGDPKLTGRQRPEHPIPAALNSALTVFTACDDCNERAGTGVDQPWLDHTIVRETRHRLKVVDPRHPGREVPHPLLAGVFEDERGHRVVVRDGQPSYPGSIVRDGDRIQIRAADRRWIASGRSSVSTARRRRRSGRQRSEH